MDLSFLTHDYAQRKEINWKWLSFIDESRFCSAEWDGRVRIDKPLRHYRVVGDRITSIAPISFEISRCTGMEHNFCENNIINASVCVKITMQGRILYYIMEGFWSEIISRLGFTDRESIFLSFLAGDHPLLVLGAVSGILAMRSWTHDFTESQFSWKNRLRTNPPKIYLPLQCHVNHYLRIYPSSILLQKITSPPMLNEIIVSP